MVDYHSRKISAISGIHRKSDNQFLLLFLAHKEKLKIPFEKPESFHYTQMYEPNRHRVGTIKEEVHN